LPEDIDTGGAAALIQEIKSKFDYCIIDSPAGLGHGFRLAAMGADRAVIVVTADASSLRDAQRVSAELELLGIRETSVLINRVRTGILRKSGSNADAIMDEVGARLAGICRRIRT
jgi:septum site-determining protein MinD